MDAEFTIGKNSLLACRSQVTLQHRHTSWLMEGIMPRLSVHPSVCITTHGFSWVGIPLVFSLHPCCQTPYVTSSPTTVLQGWADKFFSSKVPQTTISGSKSHTASSYKLYHERSKKGRQRQYANKWAWPCSNKTLFINYEI